MKWYNCNTIIRFSFDPKKSAGLRANPRRSDSPEQFIAIGWVRVRLYSIVFEAREDESGEVLHLVTLWRSTREEIHLYEANQ